MSVCAFLQSHRVPFQAVLHEPAPSATKLARSLHVPGRQVAKAVLVRAEESYALAVLPATHRIDFERLAECLGLGSVRLATEDELERVFTDCERGASPPFGRLYGLKTVVDTSLRSNAEIVFKANLRHEGVRMRYQDYEALELPIRASFAREIDPRRPEPGRRR